MATRGQTTGAGDLQLVDENGTVVLDMSAAPANVPLTTPSVQNVIDALVLLGLVEQSD